MHVWTAAVSDRGLESSRLLNAARPRRARGHLRPPYLLPAAICGRRGHLRRELLQLPEHDVRTAELALVLLDLVFLQR